MPPTKQEPRRQTLCLTHPEHQAVGTLLGQCVSLCWGTNHANIQMHAAHNSEPCDLDQSMHETGLLLFPPRLPCLGRASSLSSHPVSTPTTTSSNLEMFQFHLVSLSVTAFGRLPNLNIHSKITQATDTDSSL